MKHIVSNYDSQVSDYSKIRLSNHEIKTLSVAEKSDLITLISPLLCINSMQRFAYQKTRNSASDFEINDKIYTHLKSNDPLLKRWDEFFQEQEEPISIYDRNQYFINFVTKSEKPLRVLIIGSGSARDIKEYFDANPGSMNVFDCIELDDKAIKYATQLCCSHINKINFISRKDFRFEAGFKYNLIWSAGLFDYFTDRQFVTLLNLLRQHLVDDGELVIGNYSTECRSGSYVEKFGPWYLNHRGKTVLFYLAVLSGESPGSIHVYQEEDKSVNLYLHITN